MKKFEVGKIYQCGALRLEVIKRTAKTVTYNVIQHYGKCNENIRETKRAKIFDWETKEVFYHHNETVEA